MVYAFKVRMEQDGIFGSFDCPDGSLVMPKRSVSTTPLQALNLFNSRFILDQSETFAARLRKEAGDDTAAQVRKAWQLAFNRAPEKSETKEAVAFAKAEGLPAFCRAVLNANEFLFILFTLHERRISELQQPTAQSPPFFVRTPASGLGAIALTSLPLGRQGLLAANVRREGSDSSRHPARQSVCAAPTPHFTPKAKNVLVIFCSGACSHLDTFDYKPELIRRHGQPMPGNEKLITFQGEQGALTKSPWEFRPRGQSGKMVSDLVPHLGGLVDDMCFIHSMQGKTNTHGPGENFMSTCNTLDGFPSMGAWVTYALGSEDQSLPAYVAIPDPRGKPQNSVNNWGRGSCRRRSRARSSTRRTRFAISRGPDRIPADATRRRAAFCRS
jgi:hypothetical protein